MKVEIWSDVMCPFCYIGKRRFEDALQQFAHKDDVEIEWKSFQLNPDMVTNPDININQYLADAKGWKLNYAREMNNQVTEMAAGVGLHYNMDNAIVANSLKAHQFTHLAKKHGLGDIAEEQLFKAYFTDGKNIDDIDTLAGLGAEIGLDENEIRESITANAFADHVQQDIDEAAYLGIRGVPFFVVNGKYAISGAQAVPVFSETLEKAYSEIDLQETAIDAPVCGPDGKC